MSWYNQWGTVWEPQQYTSSPSPRRWSAWQSKHYDQQTRSGDSSPWSKICPQCNAPADNPRHSWCNHCGTRYAPTSNSNGNSFSDKALPNNLSLIIDGQVKTMQHIDLGQSPSWFKNLWMNKDSKFLKLISMEDPPPWLAELRKTSPDLLPEHLRAPAPVQVRVVPTPPAPPARDEPNLATTSLDFNNPPNWFKTLWHEPGSQIYHKLMEHFDPDNPPAWIDSLWKDFTAQLPPHLTKLNMAAYVPPTTPITLPAQRNEIPDGFPSPENNFMFDYKLYSARNQPISAYVWQGFAKLQENFTDSVVTDHATICTFVDHSKTKVDDIDDLIKELKLCRTELGRNIALSIQAKKRIEASPRWMNRGSSQQLPTPPPVPHSVANVVALMTSLSKSPAIDKDAAAIILAAIQQIQTPSVAPSLTPNTPAASPVRKKSRVGFSPLQQPDFDMDVEDDDPSHAPNLPDVDSNGIPFGATSTSSSLECAQSEPSPPVSAPPLKKKKKKKHHR